MPRSRDSTARGVPLRFSYLPVKIGNCLGSRKLILNAVIDRSGHYQTFFEIMAEENTDKTGKETAGRGWSEETCHLAGWLLFVVCALFFIASAVKNQDLLTLIGSILFLVACVVFLIPLLTSKRQR